MLDPGPNPDEEPEPECITVPVPQKVEVPAAPQHFFPLIITLRVYVQ